MNPRPPAPERFWRTVGRTLAPLLAWAAHFAVCYGGVAVGCMAWGPQAPVRTALLGASALALAVLAMMAVAAWRRPPGPLAVPAERWAVGLALLGVAWTTVPALLLPACPTG